MLSINRMDLKITPRIKKKFSLFVLVITTPEIVKNVLETKFLGANSVLKVTSPTLIHIFFYLALFQTKRMIKTRL